jgi:hypothetical protein
MSMTHKVASSPEAMHQVTGLINLAGACGWDTHFEATFHPAQTFPSKPDEVMLPAHIIYRVLGRRGLETIDAIWAAWDTHPDGAQAHVRFLGGTHYTPDGGDVAFPHYGDLRAHLRQTSGIRPSVVAEQFSDDGLLDALTHAPDGPWQDELKTEALRRMKRSTQ